MMELVMDLVRVRERSKGRFFSLFSQRKMISAITVQV
jgi:hypothetical protein